MFGLNRFISRLESLESRLERYSTTSKNRFQKGSYSLMRFAQFISYILRGITMKHLSSLILILSHFAISSCSSRNLPSRPHTSIITQQTIREILTRNSLGQVSIGFTQNQIDLQTARYGGIGFETALDGVLKSLFTPEGSNSFYDLAYNSGLCIDHSDCIQYLKAQLNDPRTKIFLVENEWDRSNHDWWPAEQGEKVDNNWIFFIEASHVDDALHWGIARRNTKSSAPQFYNYGHN